MSLPRAIAGFVATAGVLSGCGPSLLGGGGSGSAPTKEIVFAVDGVKLISSDIPRGDDVRTFLQPHYQLSPTSRLLVRYESLMKQVDAVREDYPLRLRVFAVTDADATAGKAGLKACPILKSWMMAASWHSAHPWAQGGWRPGGDIDESSCVSVEVQTAAGPLKAGETVASNISKHCSESRALCFDLSLWYRIWVLERGENFGIALIADRSVRLVGDGSAARSPRIQWFETNSSVIFPKPTKL